MDKMSHVPIARRGFMLVLSSPSGAGKTTIARHVKEEESSLELSISVTTRPKRESEKEGIDYYFTDEPAFVERVEKKEFLEQAYVFGYHYGTPKDFVEARLEAGVDVLFDIDWQGTQQLKQVATSDLVSIFILPPSLKTLEDRLSMRGEDTKETIEMRMSKAADEMSHWPEYDYIIINNVLEDSVQAVRSIIEAERLKRRSQIGLAEFVNTLRREE